MFLGDLVFGGNSGLLCVVGGPRAYPAGAMVPSLTRSRLNLFPSTSETLLPPGAVPRVLCPIGNGFFQPAILFKFLRYYS